MYIGNSTLHPKHNKSSQPTVNGSHNVTIMSKHYDPIPFLWVIF